MGFGISKVAVIGAGTMGCGIAAHLANGGVRVLLLDRVPEGANSRNVLAEKALQRMKEESPPLLTYPTRIDCITPGNMEDDFDKIAEADWIIEAVVEELDVKRELFSRVENVRKENSLVSSNTSTFPLQALQEGQSENMQRDLFVTHFFNPPRQMRLVELVRSEANDNRKRAALERFLDIRLGKTLIHAADTPGFIANRIGMFWMMLALERALKQPVPVELADSLFNKALGFPKTGVFGLFDLVGLDLMLGSVRSLQGQLPQADPFQRLDASVVLLEAMVDKGFIGNKAGAGFYRGKDKEKEVWSLQSGQYRAPISVQEEAVLKLASDKRLPFLRKAESAGAIYAREVLCDVMNYAASLVPTVAKSVLDADRAMKLGFGWRQGPFEMIDSWTNRDASIKGSSWLIGQLNARDQAPAPFLLQAEGKCFYRTKGHVQEVFSPPRNYRTAPVRKDAWRLEEKVRGQVPVWANGNARLWDIGDGITCMEFTSRLNTLGLKTFDFMLQAIEKIQKDFRGLVIGDDDRHFSAGLYLHELLAACENENWNAAGRLLRYGQQTMKALKYAPFPVVGAPSGKALGGGCELLLHCDAVQAHSESYIGLVETRIGLVPAWGGCKEMLVRSVGAVTDPGTALQAVEAVFDHLARAKVSGSAEEAQEGGSLKGGITMNRDRVLSDAKARCLSLAENYSAPKPPHIALPAAAAKNLFMQEIEQQEQGGNLTSHQALVLRHLAYVLSAGAAYPEAVGEMQLAAITDRTDAGDMPQEVTEQQLFDLEYNAFMSLIRTAETQRKIRNVL